MVQSNKFRGVRQRQWGSWVSEIRHPLLKKRIWLGTFETAEEAARAYDEASILLSGQNAKTNFPVVPSTTTSKDHDEFPLSTLSDNNILGAKLRKCWKNPAASSITCLRLDNDSSNIGVWQKRAGKDSASHWVTKIELKKNIIPTQIIDEAMDEENRVAMQMVEELLDSNNNIPAPPLSLINNIGVINYESN